MASLNRTTSVTTIIVGMYYRLERKLVFIKYRMFLWKWAFWHWLIKYHFINKTNLRSERCIAQFLSMMMVTPYSLWWNCLKKLIYRKRKSDQWDMEALSHTDLIKKVLEFSMSVSLVASAFSSHPFGFKILMEWKVFFLKRTNHSTMHFSTCKFFWYKSFSWLTLSEAPSYKDIHYSWIEANKQENKKTNKQVNHGNKIL